MNHRKIEKQTKLYTVTIVTDTEGEVVWQKLNKKSGVYVKKFNTILDKFIRCLLMFHFLLNMKKVRY